MKILRLTTVLLFFAFAEATAQIDLSPPRVFTGLDTCFDRLLGSWHAAGFAVAVVDKDQVIYAKGFGYRDYANKLPVTPETIFAIGSCTKSFTGALIGMLAVAGKLDIDKPVRYYLPELKFYNDDMNDHVTIRDMLCHRTGLPRYDQSWYFFSSHSRDSLLHRIRYLKPTAGLREKWQYNNFMYMALGAVVEKITGKSWEDNVREKIFKPLGMDSSEVSLRQLEASHAAAYGYGRVNGDKTKKIDYYDVAGMSPCGAVNSNVYDMSRWLITWIHGGAYNGKQIIPASYASAAMSPQMIISAALPSEAAPDVYLNDYGFGWMISSYRGHYRVQHGGNLDGFSANACFFPSDSIGIVVLCNQNVSGIPLAVTDMIADRLLGLKYRDWNTIIEHKYDSALAALANAPHPLAGKPFKEPAHPLTDYAGVYGNKGFGSVQVKVRQDSLFALVGKYKFWLRPRYYDIFQCYRVTPGGIHAARTSLPDYRFVMSPNGDIGGLKIKMDRTAPPILFTRYYAMPGKAVLHRYAGDYKIGAMVIHVSVAHGDTLLMLVPGQKQYQLVPAGAGVFSLKRHPAYKVRFETNDRGRVTGLLSIQPNGTFKAMKEK